MKWVKVKEILQRREKNVVHLVKNEIKEVPLRNGLNRKTLRNAIIN